MKKRDYTLDILKAFACLLLVMAHSTVLYSNTDRIMQFVGNLAPVFFYAVSAILVNDEKRIKEYSIFNIKLFIAGSTYNGIIEPRFLFNLSEFSNQFIQIIAIGNIIILYVKRYFNKMYQQVILVVSVIIFYNYLRFFSKLKINRMIVGPDVFPILPWIVYFFIGVIFYKISKRYKIVFTATVFVLTVILGVFRKSIGIIYFSKGAMDLGYMAFSILFFCVAVILAKYLKNKVENNNFIKDKIVFLSNNSLNFMYAHIYVRYFLKQIYMKNILRYVLVFIITIILIKFINYLNNKYVRRISDYVFYIVCVGSILINICNNDEFLRFLYFIIGILFSSNYRYLRGGKNKKSN